VNRQTVILVLAVLVALILGMIVNERVKMPGIRTKAEEGAREEMRAGVDSDSTLVGTRTAQGITVKLCKDARDSGVNIMPADEFLLLCLDSIEREGNIISEERIARLRKEASKDKEERLKRAAVPATSAPPVPELGTPATAVPLMPATPAPEASDPIVPRLPPLNLPPAPDATPPSPSPLPGPGPVA